MLIERELSTAYLMYGFSFLFYHISSKVAPVENRWLLVTFSTIALLIEWLGYFMRNHKSSALHADLCSLFRFITYMLVNFIAMVTILLSTETYYMTLIVLTMLHIVAQILFMKLSQ